MQILRHLSVAVVATAIVVATAGCSRTERPDKLIVDLKTNERIEVDGDYAPPKPALTPEEIEAQRRHMEEAIAVMKQFQRTLAQITDLQSLEEARPRLEDLAVRMGESMRFGEQIEELAPEVQAKYADELAAASKSLEETFAEVQKNGELWAAIQDILIEPMQKAAAGGGA